MAILFSFAGQIIINKGLTVMENRIALGTHNSWSFGKTKWFIPAFWAKCQNLNIQEQYEYGVRLFDLRLRRKKDKSWGVSHGSTFFNVDYIKDLEWLNEKGDAYVRVFLEYNSKPKNAITIESLFYDVCLDLSNEYKNIKFYGAYPKYDGSRNIFEFNTQIPLVVEQSSSTTSLFKSGCKLLAVLDDWCPWIYAKLRNWKNYEKFCNDFKEGFFMADFVEFLE